MKNTLLITLLLLCVFRLTAADYYWVGGGGDWSDLAHWRLDSPTGSIPSIVPSSADNVFFGAYSAFGTTAATRTVTLDANAYCNHMTWESDVPNSPILARAGSNTLFVNGNLELAPTVTYSNVVNVEFAGSDPATLTTNGEINSILNLTVNKPGSGLTLVDDLIYTGTTSNNSYGLTLTAGYLDASDRNVDVYSFWSQNDNPRHLDITGGRLNALRNFYFRGANKTIASTGSYVQAGIRLVTDGGAFDEVEAMSDSPNNDLFSIYNTTFKKLTFSHTSPSSNARIHGNNVVDSLIFLGAGVVREASNSIRYLSFAGNGILGGTNNMVQFAELGGSLAIIENGGHAFDTLYTAPYKTIDIRGTLTINKRFRAGGSSCDGFTEINGAASGTLHFTDGAEAEIDNVLLTNIAASGNITPIAVNGVDNGGNSGFIINTPTAASRTLYWVDGPGDWNDRNHWSESSGGPGGACVPFVTDNVIFNGASGLNAGSAIATSTNTYCHDMTWAADLPSSITFNESNSSILRVYGSVLLNPNVTVNAELRFTGAEDVTFATNGSEHGVLEVRVDKTGPTEAMGSLTLLDDWRNLPGGRLVWLRGNVNVRDRAIDIVAFRGIQAQAGHLDMRDATITVNNWEFLNAAKTVSAAGSYILAKTNIGIRAGSFYRVESSATNSNAFNIATTTIDFLTFSDPLLTSEAWVGADNTIGTLEFKGQGMIRYGGNSIDSLITGESRNFRFFASNTVNKYFKATHPDCSGLGEIRSGEGTSTIVFGPDAEVDIANVYMENMIATGGGGTLTLPIPFSGADAGGNSGWNIVASDGDARYWVGGAGDWNDAAHWSTVSGGPGGACIPTVANDVYFDANSGFGTSTVTKTITVNSGNAYFRDMDWTGAANNPILNKAGAWNMEAWGERLVLNPATTLNTAIQFRGPALTTITGQALGNLDFELHKPSGQLVIGNDYTNNQTDILLYEGVLDAKNLALTVRSVDNDQRNNNLSIDISGSTINATGHWRYNGGTSNRSLNAAGSTISSDQFLVVGFVYDEVLINGTAAAHGAFSDVTANKVVFTDVAVASGVGINGANNQLDTVEFKGGGQIYGTNNTIGTLIFFPGSRYTFNAGTNTTVTGGWFGSGTPCRLTEIVSSTTANATVTKSSGIVDFDYVRLQNITATGGAAFATGTHSVDQGGNTGWDMAPYDGASPIVGLGPDIRLSDAEFPYTISSAGFFASPLSQYEWQMDGTVVGIADALVVTGPGTYTIKVDFPDGCSVTDEIVISQDVADLVTIKALKEAARTSYAPGEEVVYTISVTNNGPDDAVDVTVADEAPEDTEITVWTATVASGTVALPNASGTGNLDETIALLPNGAEVVYEVTLLTGPGRSLDLSNTVEVTTKTPDPVTGCEDCTTVPLPAAPLAGVSVTKALADAGQIGFVPGENVIYTITLTNVGPSDARDVVIEDSAPAGTTIGEWTAAVAVGEVTLDNTSGTGDLNETIAILPSGAVIAYTVTVETPTDHTASLVNTVSATAGTDDPDHTDNTATTAGLPSVPDAPIGVDQIECAESPVQTLTAMATVPMDVTVAWYDAASGGNLIASPMLNAIGTVTYYGEAQKGALISLTRTPVSLTINGLPGLVVTEPEVTCSGDTVDLTAAAVTAGSDSGLAYTYHTDVTGTMVLEDADAVATSGTYYIRGTDPLTGCSTILPVTVQFVDRPVVIVVHPDCTVGTGTITLTEPLGTGYEYSINGVDYQTSPVFEDVAPGTYMATAQHASVPGCVSDPQAVTINAAPTTYMPTVAQPDCNDPLGQITFPSDPDYEFAIYQTGDTPVFQTSSSFTDIPSGTYLAEMRLIAGGCNALPITLVVDEAPEVPAAPVSGGDQVVCALDPLQILTAEATVPGGATLSWYDAPIGGNVVAAPTLDTVGTITYYAEAGNGDCVSATRTAVTLTIHPMPVIDADLLVDRTSCGPYTFPPITGTDFSNPVYRLELEGVEYFVLPGQVFQFGPSVDYGVYTLSIRALGNCGDYESSSFTLTLNETPEAGTIGTDQSICYGETPGVLSSGTVGTGTGTISYRWESSSDGISWSVITDANDATYQPYALTSTTYYRRITAATANGLTCESGPTAVVTVSVTDELTANAGIDQTEYHNGTFTLDANVPALGNGEWSVVSTEGPAVFNDITNPAASITLAPNTSVTLRWTVTEGDCSVFDEVTLTSVHGADVAVIKTLKDTDQLGYVPGSEVDYVITVRNNGPAYAEQVRIQDVVPADVTLVDWTAQVTSGTVFLPSASGSNVLDETLLILPNGAAVLYEVRIRPSEEMNADLVNIVEISTATVDADLSNNSAITPGLPAVPDAPISGGDQEICAENPVRTLTATATVPAGRTVTWYDAPSGGNAVAVPMLDGVGTVTYYAQAQEGSLGSTQRTPVTLTIRVSPMPDLVEDVESCGVYTLPAIIGRDLTGNEAYYTGPGGTGDRYLAGEVISDLGTTVLYIHDVTPEGCEGETSFEVTIGEVHPGTIGSAQNIPFNGTPEPIRSLTDGTGPGNLSYRWEISGDGVSWLPIPSATGATYQPGALTTATSYRRITVVTMDEGSLCESGPTAAVRITVSPSDGPIANDDFVSTAADTPITFDPIANDRQGSLPIDAASVRFIDPENGNEVVFLEIQGEGTWEIDPFTGGVTFSPETGFTGETTPIGYLLYDGIGAASNPALLIVAVMATPRAENDNSFPETVPGAYAGNVLDNDSMAGNPIDPDAVTISFSDPGNTGITIDESGEIYVPVGTEPGVHTLSYTLCDVNFPELCDTATVTLTIGSVDLTVHNVISPNGDGVNDHLVIKGIEAYPDNVVEIYNRWGVQVFKARGYNNSGKVFDGISDARITLNEANRMPAGTYYYVLHYTMEGKSQSKMGWIYIQNNN